MKKQWVLFLSLSTILLITGCSKSSSNSGGGGTSCNNVIMRMKKMQSLSAPGDSLATSWNSDGTINKITTNLQLQNPVNVTFVYSGGKAIRGILRYNSNNAIYDTVEYHYNADNLVDSMYLRRTKNSYSNMKIVYSAGKIIKLSGYDGTIPTFYWTVTSDANGNVTQAEEFWKNGATWKKETQYTYTRDDRKNPVAGLAVYMLANGSDAAYKFFRLWGPNNMVDQRYVDYTNGADVTSGYKYTYNGNCYPEASQVTIGGVAFFPGNDFQFTYY